MRRILSRYREEKAAALTEFVITLPIFVMIFAGMGMLYAYTHAGMIARMKTNRMFVDDLTANNNIESWIPSQGGTIATEWFDIDYHGSGEKSLYYDSALKAGFAEFMVPGTAIANPANPVTPSIMQITGMTGGLDATVSWTNMLLNDAQEPTWDSSGWANILMSIAMTVGVTPAIGAGIRYEPIAHTTSYTFSHPWTGSQTYNPGELSAPAPTAAHTRAASVAAARIAMNTVEPFKACILEFDGFPPCLDGNPGTAVTTNDNSNDMYQLEEDLNACNAQVTVWQNCLDSCDIAPPSWPSCDSGGGCLIPTCTSCDCYCSNEEPDSSCADAGPGDPTSGCSWCGFGDVGY